MSSIKHVIYGAGGHSRSIADVILSNEPNADIVFVDAAAKPNETIFNFNVSQEYSPNNEDRLIVAVGDNLKRQAITKTLPTQPFTLIANDAHIGTDTAIGAGSYIAHDAYIGPLVNLGEGCIVNTRAILEHEVRLGDYSQIAPGVIIGGRVNIGENVFVGLGASIIDNITICSDVIIGAAAVVVDDIDSPGTYVGIPARKIHD